MKGSGVFHGIASWISKLHPQLPLSPKESQRLLTALTTSFRRQLDQSHPHPSNGKESKPTPKPVGPSKASVPNVQTSSFHSADKHLASVLANPLLAKSSSAPKPKHDFNSAREALSRDPFQDTVTLLERYQESGAANVKIAMLCLQTYKSQLDDLSTSERQSMLKIRRAGERTLHWLWQSGFNDTAEYVDDKEHVLNSVMVPLLIEEGHEELLWKLLELDIKLGPPQVPGRLSPKATQGRRERFRYRWKESVVHNIVVSKLQKDQSDSADGAIDAVIRASRLTPEKSGGIQHRHTANILARRLLDHDERLLMNTNLSKYDLFIELHSEFNSKSFPVDQYLELMRPLKPNPKPLVARLRVAFDDCGLTKPDAKDRLRDQMLDRNHTTFHAYGLMFPRLIAALRLQKNFEDAGWVTQLYLTVRPEERAHVEKNVRVQMAALEERGRMSGKALEERRASTESRDIGGHAPVGMPSFV